MRLGVNQKYADAIYEGAERSGLSPTVVAAIIHAEAGKIHHGEWNPASYNKTGALGLGQMRPSAWIEVSEKHGTLLNELARQQQWLTEFGKLKPENQSALLALRLDPRHSIVAAAEYDAMTLKQLLADRPSIHVTRPADQAKLIYLLHHEGLTGAKQFLDGAIPERNAETRLKANVKGRFDLLVEQYGTAAAAYSAWLESRLEKINPSRFEANSKADAAVAPAATPAAHR
ncbi:MAG: hypothetical protein JWM77_1049 [Rhodospirillales bacterium]|nr:hypothetical protein [Rhodospirillales bacterium]